MVYNMFLLNLRLDPGVFDPFTEVRQLPVQDAESSKEDGDYYELADEGDITVSTEFKSCLKCRWGKISNDPFAGSSIYMCCITGEEIVDEKVATKCTNFESEVGTSICTDPGELTEIE